MTVLVCQERGMRKKDRLIVWEAATTVTASLSVVQIRISWALQHPGSFMNHWHWQEIGKGSTADMPSAKRPSFGYRTSSARVPWTSIEGQKTLLAINRFAFGVDTTRDAIHIYCWTADCSPCNEWRGEPFHTTDDHRCWGFKIIWQHRDTSSRFYNLLHCRSYHVPRGIYQQDNAQPHMVRIPQEKHFHIVDALSWLAKSSDLAGPFEHFLHVLGRQVLNLLYEKHKFVT